MIVEHTLTLNNGVRIPVIGLGVFRNPAGEVTRSAVRYALEAGYRLIDTAKVYGNEQSVGEAIRESGIPRSEVFVTTKLWNSDQGYEAAQRACAESLRKMGLDNLDLYLVHWPVKGIRLETWRAMESLLADGKCRAIGVSNYMVQHLEELLEHCAVTPAVNQIELSPYNYLSRKQVIDLCRTRGIQVEAYSPLTKGLKLKDSKLVRIAQTYAKSTAQVLVRWAVQHGFVVLPKSSSRERIRQNADVFDFAISEADMATLNSFDENLVTGWDPTDAP
jgi:diketogulonate reductase-like aldo/keto reductase